MPDATTRQLHIRLGMSTGPSCALASESLGSWSPAAVTILSVLLGLAILLAWRYHARYRSLLDLDRKLDHGLETTERGRAEDTRRNLDKQLRLAQKMEALGLLAGGVAHDFNNLLTVVAGHASMIQDHTADADKIRHHAGEILKAQERAGELTRQLLAFGRRQVSSPRPLDLCGLVQDYESMLRRVIGEQIDLVVEASHDDCIVVADAGQLEQVILNLAINARDAMPSGGRMTVSCRPEVFSHAEVVGDFVIPPGEYVVLSVVDTGTGIDAPTRARMFEPFFTTKTRSNGTGLGLSTVYGIVQQSNGQIVVLSEPGHGAEFRVFLHRSQSPASSIRKVASGPPATNAGTETVLIAEDEPSILHLVRTTLEKYGYRVLVASDGEEALRTARAAKSTIDLLLTDLVMPRMGGPALAREFRREFPDAAILAMTGYSATGNPTRFGAAAVLAKPFTPSSLVATVRRVLDEHAAARRARTERLASSRSERHHHS